MFNHPAIIEALTHRGEPSPAAKHRAALKRARKVEAIQRAGVTRHEAQVILAREQLPALTVSRFM